MRQTLPIWQIDAFSNEPFKGNPAAVCVHHDTLSDALMQQIAMEMNLSETAFIFLRDGKQPLLRWFTPTCEIDLCGHATLSAAHVLWEESYISAPEITFKTKYVGHLSVTRLQQNHYCMAFPNRAGEVIEITDIPPEVLEGLQLSEKDIVAVRKSRDLMLVLPKAEIVRGLTPNFTRLQDYPDYVIVTAASDLPEYDFISRFFCADDGIAEDPVTGSAHCTLAPYWSDELGKNELTAYQASARGGLLELTVNEELVRISGHALTVLKGELTM